jgi:ATP-dependent Lhr-like helicase
VRTPSRKVPNWKKWLAALAKASRQRACCSRQGTHRARPVADGRTPDLLQAIYPQADAAGAIERCPPMRAAGRARHGAARSAARAPGRAFGPVPWRDCRAAVPAGHEVSGPAQLEREGYVLRGRFTPGTAAIEWCERHLLARIHRYTVKRLRREIEPVALQDFMRFLFDWQHLSSASTRGQGSTVLPAIVGAVRRLRGGGFCVGQRHPPGAAQGLFAELAG